MPQSLRQQELVCLTASHINCPRYLRGALVASDATSRRRLSPVLTPAITVALAVLVLSFGVSVAFVVANGGLTLPVAAVAASAAPTGTATAVGPTGSPDTAGTPDPVRRRIGGCGLAGAALDIAGPDADASGSDARADTQADEDAEAEAQLEPLRPPHALPEQA